VNVAQLIGDLRQQDIHLVAEGEKLIVDAPPGHISPNVQDVILANKPQIMTALRQSEALAGDPTKASSPLVEYARQHLPMIRLTFVQTDDILHDFKVLDTIRHVVQQFEPGGNRIRLRLVTNDGRRVVVEWFALADRELRLALARVLAAEGRNRVATMSGS
jgi:hypothetical protein